MGAGLGDWSAVGHVRLFVARSSFPSEDALTHGNRDGGRGRRRPRGSRQDPHQDQVQERGQDGEGQGQGQGQEEEEEEQEEGGGLPPVLADLRRCFLREWAALQSAASGGGCGCVRLPAVTVVPVEALEGIAPPPNGPDGSGPMSGPASGAVLRLVAQVTAVDTLRLDTERWTMAAE